MKNKWIIGCEFSGVIREAMKKRGIDTWSCDLLPSEVPGQHIQGNILEHLDDGWSGGIFHPPCTFLAVSGARWFREREQELALEFVRLLMNAPIEKIAIENPISVISTRIRKPDQSGDHRFSRAGTQQAIRGD